MMNKIFFISGGKKFSNKKIYNILVFQVFLQVQIPTLIFISDACRHKTEKIKINKRNLQKFHIFIYNKKGHHFK